MAESLNTEKLDVQQKMQIDKLAKERLIWLIKPLGAVILILFVLSPEISAHPVVQRETLLGFLLGACYGILAHYKVLNYYLFSRKDDTREQKNRLPDEFYWGKKKVILFKK